MAHDREERLVGKLKKRDHLKDIGIHEDNIKMDRENDGKAWRGLVWLRIWMRGW
jgi:hypothetical protein